MKLFQTTKKWYEWWSHRNIDWRKAYLSTWKHPHRQLITHVLGSFQWFSLMEIGCGAGANLVNIVQGTKGKQLGGVDVNPEAIKVCSEVLQGAFLRVGNILDIPMSDNSADVLLTDMTLIYISPKKIGKALAELKRVARRHILLCELHTTSFWSTIKIRLFEGYYMRDYKRLLEKHGFYDIELIKIRPEHWPESTLQQSFAFIIKAVVPKRK